MNRPELLSRISTDTNICFGKPCIKGHRIWVSLILDLLAGGMTPEEVLQQYPGIVEADILACIAYGAEMARERYVEIRILLHGKARSRSGSDRVWALARVEAVSALHRKARAGELPAQLVATARDRLDKLSVAWTEIDALIRVRDRAERLLAVHALRSADALQLAAALLLTEERPRGVDFLVSDERLSTAAGAEGFAIVAPH